MKEMTIFIAALIIIGGAIFISGTLLFLAMADRKKRRDIDKKENELQLLSLNMKNGDEQAKLKMEEQLLHFKERSKKAEYKAIEAKNELEKFKRILDLLDPERQEEMQTVQLPKNLETLSYKKEDEEDRVYLIMDDLDDFLQTQEELMHLKEESKIKIE